VAGSQAQNRVVPCAIRRNQMSDRVCFDHVAVRATASATTGAGSLARASWKR